MLGRRVGLIATLMLGVLGAVLATVLCAGVASAQAAPTPQPYGGALDGADPGDEVSAEQVLEVGMLCLGTLNGLAFAGALIASRLRGPSAAQTRHALASRTGAGTVSESRRERRERATRRVGEVPVPAAPAGVVPAQARPAGGVAPGARAVVPPGGAPLSPPAGMRSPAPLARR